MMAQISLRNAEFGMENTKPRCYRVLLDSLFLWTIFLSCHDSTERDERYAYNAGCERFFEPRSLTDDVSR